MTPARPGGRGPRSTARMLATALPHRKGVLAALAAVALAVAWVVAPAAATAAPHARPPERSHPFLLALGDSISFGFQASKVGSPPDPAAFSTGYADVLAARDRRLRVTNYSCPGETTTSMIDGSCPWTAAGFALHDDYQGSQLVAADAFLRAHRREPGTVTLAIWGNDVAALSAACHDDLDCVAERAPAEVAAFGDRLGRILRSLRSAAPSARVVVVAAVHSFPPPSPEIDALYAALNRTIASTASTAGAAVADIVPVFDPPDPAERTAAICTLTLTCVSNGADGHPSDAGYRAIADAITAVIRRPCPS